MRILEVRRHSLTKKGAGRGTGSHLSQAGVELARRVGSSIGPFDRVVTTSVPRTLETAIAMGFAVDLQDDAGLESEDAFSEVGHHDRWNWAAPFAVFADLVRNGGATARLGRAQADAWRRAVGAVPEGGSALVISHGRVIETAMVTCLPNADHAAWGAPFQHCEGALLAFDGERFTVVEVLRVGQPTAPSPGPSPPHRT